MTTTDRTYNPAVAEDMEALLAVLQQQHACLIIDRADAQIELREARFYNDRWQEHRLAMRLDRIEVDLNNVETELQFAQCRLHQLSSQS